MKHIGTNLNKSQYKTTALFRNTVFFVEYIFSILESFQEFSVE